MKLVSILKNSLKASPRTPKAPRKNRGVSLLEVMVSSTVSLLAITGAVALMIQGSTVWYKGEGKMLAETQSQRAVRMISGELREAMSVTVDGNGLGVSYRLPVIDSNTGNYTTPAIWDNVTRRIEYLEGNLRVVTGGSARVISHNVILTDPQSTGGASSYVIFAPGTGLIIRKLSVMVATQTSTTRGSYTKSRSRETIYLRNIPELSRG